MTPTDHGPTRSPPQTFVIPYSVVGKGAGAIIRPLVAGRLSWEGNIWEGTLLADSGADFSFIPRRIAEDLRLPLHPPTHSIRPAGEVFTALESAVYVQVTDKDVRGRQGRPFLLSPVLVPEDERILEEPILGQVGFMDRFEVTLRRKEREFVLREAAR